MTLYDTRGEEIAMGSTIIYAVKGSTHIRMHEGVVEGFWTQQGYGYDYPRHMIRVRRTHDKKTVEIFKTNTVVVVSPRLTVPEGAILARVSIEDGIRRTAGQHIISNVATRAGDMGEILKGHTFPYLVEQAVDKHLG